jgi:thiamine-phosphate pyrophosphorylase
MIPKLHYISQGETPEEHLNNIQKACASGVELVQLHLKSQNQEIVLETAKKAREITKHFQTRLIINGHYKIAIEVKADGVHLEKSDICPTIVRRELSSWQLIGATANTLKDCEKLINKKVDYIGLGPFRVDKTKENLSLALGEKGYLTILNELKTDIPVFAFGGITMNDILDIMITGVYGIAISEEITRDFNTIPKFKEVINGSATEEQRWNFEENKKK